MAAPAAGASDRRSVIDILLGKPLSSVAERGERVGIAAGIPIFGLDALSSAAYGPEAALTLLIPLGAVGVAYIVPISVSIIVLLTIVYLSYLQTIETYPGGEDRTQLPAKTWVSLRACSPVRRS
jgi:hypothetical protein